MNVGMNLPVSTEPEKSTLQPPRLDTDYFDGEGS